MLCGEGAECMSIDRAEIEQSIWIDDDSVPRRCTVRNVEDELWKYTRATADLLASNARGDLRAFTERRERLRIAVLAALGDEWKTAQETTLVIARRGAIVHRHGVAEMLATLWREGIVERRDRHSSATMWKRRQ